MIEEMELCDVLQALSTCHAVKLAIATGWRFEQSVCIPRWLPNNITLLGWAGNVAERALDVTQHAADALPQGCKCQHNAFVGEMRHVSILAAESSLPVLSSEASFCSRCCSRCRRALFSMDSFSIWSKLAICTRRKEAS